MLETLRSIYRYDPLTGAITHLTHRGPKKPGDSAICIQSQRPTIWVAGLSERWPAARLAWLLHTGEDPTPPDNEQFLSAGEWLELEKQGNNTAEERPSVWCKDGDLFNLKFSNLEINAGRQPLSKPTEKRRRAKKRSDIGIRRARGGYEARITYRGKQICVGVFLTKYEAMAARQGALAEAQAGRLPINTNDRRKTRTVERRLDYDRYYKVLVNALRMQPGDNPDHAVVIDKFPNKFTRFANVPIGAKFFYDTHFWIKISHLEAATCDWRPNFDRRMKPGARVQLILSMAIA